MTDLDFIKIPSGQALYVMPSIQLFTYNLGLAFYHSTIRLAQYFNPKAQKWIAGRKNIFQRLEAQIQHHRPIVWVHVASLGEFEQGRPIIEQIKTHHPTYQVLLTFFSPSGYEIRKNYPQADYVFYLPLDTSKNAQQFLNIVRPHLAIFVKYEFWYHYLTELQHQNIPAILVAALFRPQQFFFKWYGQYFQRLLHGFAHIFVQNSASHALLKKVNIQNVTVAGDTRLDRVYTISQHPKSFPLIEAFLKENEKMVLICGSTWPQDEAIISAYINQYTDELPLKIIIAPHVIKTNKINQLVQKISQPVVRYSEATLDNIVNYDICIIDNIGMLSALYQYGDIAYIGGAFGDGLHNTLEPIVFGLPVLFGNKKYRKFEEAIYLVAKEGGFAIQHLHDFKQVLQQLEDAKFYQKASHVAKQYVLNNKGGTEKIMAFLKQNMLISPKP